MTFVKRIFGLAALGMAVLLGLSSTQAQAGYVVTLGQLGSNVVASGSGPLNLTDLTYGFTSPWPPSLAASGAVVVTGPTGFSSVDAYSGFANLGPSNFGNSNGGSATPDSGSGDIVGIFGVDGSLLVPAGYVSCNSPSDTCTSLSSTSTFLDTTIADLGLTLGTYKWQWGADVNQSFTVIVSVAPGTVIPPTPVSEPATILLLGLGLTGLAMRRRRRAQ